MQDAARVRRVAFVLGRCGRGGTELQAQLLVRGLRSRGVSVDVLVLEGEDFAGDFGDAPLQVLCGGRRSSVGSTRDAIRSALQLRRWLQAGQYDVVHAAMARAYVLAPLVAPRRPRPLIVAWRRNLGVHLGSSRLRLTAERLASRRSDVLVANSQSGREYWSDVLRISPGRIELIHNALEPWRFDLVAPAPVSLGVERLVSLGGLKVVKGHELLIEAAAALRISGRAVEVVVLGDGPTREHLMTMADRLAVPLHLPGHVDDPRSWLSSATLYVHPSYSEGASNAVAEAMAQGCAIVATEVGGTAEVLGGTGQLVKPGDVEGLAAAIQALLDDPGERKRLGAAARDRALTAFSSTVVVDRHLDIYGGK